MVLVVDHLNCRLYSELVNQVRQLGNTGHLQGVMRAVTKALEFLKHRSCEALWLDYWGSGSQEDHKASRP